MDKSLRKILSLSFFLFISIFAPAVAQSYFTDFEDAVDNPIWKNVNLQHDSLAYSGQYVTKCDNYQKYSFGINILISDSIKNHNGLVSFDMMLRADTVPDATFVVSIKKDKETVLWKTYPISEEYNAENQWYNKKISFVVPNDFLKNSLLNCYLYNPNKNVFCVDDFSFKIDYFDLPDFLPETEPFYYPNLLHNITASSHLNVLYSKKDKNIILSDDKLRIITKPLSLFNSFVCNNDTIEYQSDRWKFVSHEEKSELSTFTFKNDDDYFTTFLEIEYYDADPNVDFRVKMLSKQDLYIQKLSLLIPFRDNDFIVYRKNMLMDSIDYQNVYYLDKEGFSLRYDEKQLNLYHPDDVSSIQLDVEKSLAFVNIDYHYDHPLSRYELMDTVDFYVDNSAYFMKKKSVITSHFTVSLTNKTSLPRLMPVMNGYESAIIFTEHADWTDIKTHRATYFGSEEIFDADSAVGGYVFYDVPVTKSVFYNNPDSVNNFEINSLFPDLHTTIMTDSSFFDFLSQLSKRGFDICLHTPEQYTSTQKNLKEALEFMKENFSSPSWIDHGYNNSLNNNREDLMCDGLDSESEYYVYDLWKENGVMYPFNASYEEMTLFDEWFFYNQLLQPYPGFGDAIPLPKVMRLRDYPDILLWATASTMDPFSNWAWDYFFSQFNLDKIVDFRSVFITHCYSPWVTEERGYWETDNGTIVAKKGFNKALERISNLEKQKLMLPTTIAEYMRYQKQLMNVEYRLDDDGSVRLKNLNQDEIKGLSLICDKEIKINEKEYNIRKTKSGDEWIIWFDIEPDETVEVIMN